MGLGGLVFQALKTVFREYIEVMVSILSFFVAYSRVFTLLGVYRRTKGIERSEIYCE
jgi:Na+/alanine symporter